MNYEVASIEKRGDDYYIDLNNPYDPADSMCIRIDRDMFRQLRTRLLSGRKPS